MATITTAYPKYEALWPPYHSLPFAHGEPQVPCLIREADARFDAWAPAPGNVTPGWSYVSTPAVNSGKFIVGPGGWFDPGDHPNVEIYFILAGTLHLSNPDTSQVVKLVPGDAAMIPAWAHHHGYNFGDEDAVIYWWVPGEMHTDLFKQKVENGTLYELGWYERDPVVLNGPHTSNDGFPSRLDAISRWPDPTLRPEPELDMERLGPDSWLRLIQGSEPRQTVLTSFFYSDETIRCGHIQITGYRDTQPEVCPWEKLVYVTRGSFCVLLTGTPDVLRGEPGDVIFIPPGVEHSYLTATTGSAEAVFGLARPLTDSGE